MVNVIISINSKGAYTCTSAVKWQASYKSVLQLASAGEAQDPDPVLVILALESRRYGICGMAGGMIVENRDKIPSDLLCVTGLGCRLHR